MAYMHVPDVINELLDRTGYPQWKLAKELKCSQATISKWLSSKQSPTKKQWDRIQAYASLKGLSDNTVDTVNANPNRGVGIRNRPPNPVGRSARPAGCGVGL